MPEKTLYLKWKVRSSGVIHTARHANLRLEAFRFQQAFDSKPAKWRWFIGGSDGKIIKLSPPTALYRTSEEACEAAERWVTGTEPWDSRTADRLTHSRRNNHGTNKDASTCCRPPSSDRATEKRRSIASCAGTSAAASIGDSDRSGASSCAGMELWRSDNEPDIAGLPQNGHEGQD